MHQPLRRMPAGAVHQLHARPLAALAPPPPPPPPPPARPPAALQCNRRWGAQDGFCKRCTQDQCQACDGEISRLRVPAEWGAICCRDLRQCPPQRRSPFVLMPPYVAPALPSAPFFRRCQPVHPVRWGRAVRRPSHWALLELHGPQLRRLLRSGRGQLRQLVSSGCRGAGGRGKGEAQAQPPLSAVWGGHSRCGCAPPPPCLADGAARLSPLPPAQPVWLHNG